VAPPQPVTGGFSAAAGDYGQQCHELSNVDHTQLTRRVSPSSSWAAPSEANQFDAERLHDCEGARQLNVRHVGDYTHHRG